MQVSPGGQGPKSSLPALPHRLPQYHVIVAEPPSERPQYGVPTVTSRSQVSAPSGGGIAFGAAGVMPHSAVQKYADPAVPHLGTAAGQGG